MKKALSLLLCLLMACSMLTACQKTDGNNNGDQQNNNDTKIYKFALVSNGPVTDGDWNENSWKGLQAIKEKYPDTVEVTYSENVAQADYENTFYGYGKDGYDLVIANGFEFSNAVFNVCDEFPETKYAIVNGLEYRENVCSLEFDNVEFGYLCGVAMTLVAKERGTNVAFICAEAIPSYRNFYLGLETAVKEYGGGQVSSKDYYTGDWVDITKGTEAAMTAISNNEKVLVPWIGAVNHAIYSVVDEQNCMFVNTSFDLGSDSYLDNLVITLTQNNRDLVEAGCQSVIDGTYPANGALSGTFANGLNHLGDFGESLSDEQKATIQEVYNKLLKGEIQLPEKYKA